MFVCQLASINSCVTSSLQSIILFYLSRSIDLNSTLSAAREKLLDAGSRDVVTTTVNVESELRAVGEASAFRV